MILMSQTIAPHATFTINDHAYNMCYLLANGIYPDWSIFQKTILEPLGEKRKWYSKMQEGARKDVERAFGILQARWRVLRYLACLWSESIMKSIWKVVVIIHNMVVEDEKDDVKFNSKFWVDHFSTGLEQQ